MASSYVDPTHIPISTLGVVERSSEAILVSIQSLRPSDCPFPSLCTVQAPLSTQGPYNPQNVRPMGPAVRPDLLIRLLSISDCFLWHIILAELPTGNAHISAGAWLL